jgi:hypothetical protein
VCTDGSAPSSRLDGTRVSRRRVNIFGSARDVGCTSDGRVARVQVAVARRVRGGCRYLKRNRRFSARKRCGKPHFLAAKAGYSSRLRASRFRLKRTGLTLARGRYRVTVRAIDGTGNFETRRSRSRIRNVRVR